MKILIACEFSGIVRDAFMAKGHDVTSCDLLPTERPGKHYQGDVFNIINDGWDMMIARPPCTYLSYAGTGWFNEERYGDKARERKKKRGDGMRFFLALYNAPIPKVAVENPVGYPNSVFRKADQVIQPYFFGDNHVKRTCLWLRGLPPLEFSERDNLFRPATQIPKPAPLVIHERKPSKYYNGGEKKNRYFTDAGTRDAHIRSITFPGIANAMAEQWG